MIPFTVTSATWSDSLCAARPVAGMYRNKEAEKRLSEGERKKQWQPPSQTPSENSLLRVWALHVPCLQSHKPCGALPRPQTTQNHRERPERLQITLLDKCGHKSPPTSLWTFAVLCSALKLQSVAYITVWFNCSWKAMLERLLKTFSEWQKKKKKRYPFSQRKPRYQAFFAIDYIRWAEHRRNHRCWHCCGRLRWTLKPIVSVHFLSLLYFFLPLLLSAIPPSTLVLGPGQPDRAERPLDGD